MKRKEIETEINILMTKLSDKNIERLLASAKGLIKNQKNLQTSNKMA